MGPYYQAFPEGGSIKLYADDAKRNYEEVARWSRRDAEAMPRWDAWLEGLADVLGPLLLTVPPRLGSRNPRDLAETLRLAWRHRGLSVRTIADVTRLMTMSIAEHGPERVARDQRAQPRHRRIERMAVAGHQMNAGAMRRRDHRAAFIERQRHRLLDQEMLAVPGGEHRVADVILMRGRDIDRLDPRVGAQLLDRGIARGGEIRGKARPGLGAGIRRRHQRHARIGGKGRQHQGKGAAEAGDTQTKPAFGSVAQGSARLDNVIRCLYLR